MTNVAVVVLDTLRKTHFDKYFDWLPGTRFEAAYSTSHWTVPAHASLFTGRYPSEVGVHVGSKDLDCKEPVLAEIASDLGYKTRMFSANPNITPNWAFDRGFDQFEGSWRVRSMVEDVFDWHEFLSKTDPGLGRYGHALREIVHSDSAIIASLRRGIEIKLRGSRYNSQPDDGSIECLEWLRTTPIGDDEFMFINLMEAHVPYDPPAPFDAPEVALNDFELTFGGATSEMEAATREAYDEAAAYQSDIYEDIHKELSQHFDVIVTLSDHGEMLGEHGVFEHGIGLYEELVHIPLCISGIDRENNAEVRSIMDVFATIVDLLGGSTTRRGQPLTEASNTTVVTEYHGPMEAKLARAKNAGVDFNTARLTTERRGLREVPFYAHQTVWDEIITHGSPPDNIKDRIDKVVESIPCREVDSSREELSESVRSQLEELGYM